MGYRLLIVDDEEWIRKGVRARLAYLKLEFDEVYEAGSGSEGLGLLENNGVDIIITDIRMPDMDGLTFISRVRERNPGVKFLILSGYAEFRYASQAIHLGASAYLLKPLSNQELQKAMEAMILQLREEECLKKAVYSGKKLQKEEEVRQFERELNHLLSDTAPRFHQPEEGHPGKELFPYPSIRKMCPWLEDTHSQTTFYVGVFAVEHGTEPEKEEDLELACFIVKNVFMELPGACRKVMVSGQEGGDGVQIAVFASGQEGFRAEAETVYFKIRAALEQILSMSLSLGISGPLKRPEVKGREQAEESLKQRMVCGRPGIFFYEDVAALGAAPVPGAQLHMLRYFMEKNDREKISMCIHKLLNQEPMGTHNATYLNMIWVRILSMVMSVIHEQNGENSLQVHGLLGGFKEFDAMHTLEEMEETLTQTVIHSLTVGREDPGSSADRIRLAADYIRENYNTPISVNWLAERFGMSPNYFSTMFKKETGQSAGSYITALRIEAAKEMLAKNDQPAADIARETGYDDPQYFFRVFKRETGQTPIQYRDRARKEQTPHDE